MTVSIGDCHAFTVRRRSSSRLQSAQSNCSCQHDRQPLVALLMWCDCESTERQPLIGINRFHAPSPTQRPIGLRAYWAYSPNLRDRSTSNRAAVGGRTLRACRYCGQAGIVWEGRRIGRHLDVKGVGGRFVVPEGAGEGVWGGLNHWGVGRHICSDHVIWWLHSNSITTSRTRHCDVTRSLAPSYLWRHGPRDSLTAFSVPPDSCF